MKDKKVTVGLIQMQCSDSPRENLEKMMEMTREAASKGAEVVCTQELFLTPYPCQEEDPELFDWAEPIPGPTTERLGELSKELGITIVASLFERRMAGVYHNTSAVLDTKGEIAGMYRKTHIPDDPHYYEKFYFTPGDLGYPVISTQKAKVASLVCWDQWFPEAARLMALGGAEVLFYPTAIGWFEKDADLAEAQHEAWETMQRSHAIANGMFVCGINRIGREGHITFFGQSFIADPFGRILYRASKDKEEAIVQTLDLSLIEKIRRDWPFLRDRRIDAYGDILERARK